MTQVLTKECILGILVKEFFIREEKIMAVPKYKTSKAKAASRKASNMKLAAPTLCKCPSCGNMILPHRVCPKCGYYKGQQVVELEK